MPSRQNSTPLELTRQLLDVSVTERGAFRSCRRRWWYSTVENLEPKTSDDMALQFGRGIHLALEAYYRSLNGSRRRSKALRAWNAWAVEQRKLAPDNDSFARIVELDALGLAMLNNYFEYDTTAKVQLGKPLAVEGLALDRGLKLRRPSGYPPSAQVIRHDSGRLLVPIVDPDTKHPIDGPGNGAGRGMVMLSMRMDLLTERQSPMRGLWIVDHKTTGKAPSDRGIDFDDQITGYCYGVYRWTGQIPRGVIYNSLIKQAPKDPRILQSGALSTAKDQLTTPTLYRAALEELGLMQRGKILSEDHAVAMGALLARGWDPFFRRFEVMRNAHELESFERHLVNEYEDMVLAWTYEEARYPNRSTWWCPQCPVNKICMALEDGSDVEFVIENQYVVAPDRKDVR